jgi:ubiquinone/menaquinone biosynthesis C-methylase UbiE
MRSDARRVDIFDDNSFDAGLLMSLLYHLSEKIDREAVLAIFFRTLKPGAKGIVAYLNSWGLNV